MYTDWAPTVLPLDEHASVTARLPHMVLLWQPVQERASGVGDDAQHVRAHGDCSEVHVHALLLQQPDASRLSVKGSQATTMHALCSFIRTRLYHTLTRPVMLLLQPKEQSSSQAVPDQIPN